MTDDDDRRKAEDEEAARESDIAADRHDLESAVRDKLAEGEMGQADRDAAARERFAAARERHAAAQDADLTREQDEDADRESREG